jgi:hypothetical protein
MPQVRAGIVWDHLEVYHHRQAQKVPRFDGHIERVIIEDSHRALHPVNNAPSAYARRTAPAHKHTRLARKLRQIAATLDIGWQGIHAA